MSFRIGFGFDVHQLQENARFTLGGVQVDHGKGGVGHSDADVVIHAICDALLGAANLGDIGIHFPPSDDAYQDIDSKALLHEVSLKLKDQPYTIGNIDVTVCLQKPKITSYLPSMKAAIADWAYINEDQISIKATTTEKLGYVGQEEGVSAYAIALIQSG
jgi:2-C-methyl-D-erythritol 2,4-cyclodiphosphate synthase